MSSKKPKTTVIAVRVSIEQREAIETAAITAGTSVSGFIAATMGEVVLRKKAAPAPAAARPLQATPTAAVGISVSDPTALAELKRIGININQLAHAANAGYPPNVVALLDNLKRLFATLSEPDAFKKHVDRISPIAGLGQMSDETRTKPSVAPTTQLPPTAPPQRRPLPPHLAASIAEAAAARPKPASPRPSATTSPQESAPGRPPRPTSQAPVKDDSRETQHPQSRNQLQSRPELRPPRSAKGDGRTGGLGFFRKLWDG